MKYKWFDEYEFYLFDDVEQMIAAIRDKDKRFGLCRTVAGFSWKWVSKENPNAFDIKIGNYVYKWNSTDQDWVNSDTSVDEIGCIHTIQGYGLNYAGVIFGYEIDYDEDSHCLVVNKNEYHDTVGKSTIANRPDLLKEYICNIYRTLLTRGIRGTYVYACNPSLRRYLARFIDSISLDETL